MSPEQYLVIERLADFRSEYCRGEMFPMTGGSSNHNIISRNIDIQFYTQRPEYEVYRSDMRVEADKELFAYPDVVVVCDKPQFLDNQFDTLLNPMAIAEVLSRSTASYDRTVKLDYYRSIKSLQQYLLVAQDRMHVDLYTRTDAGWMLTSAEGPDASIEFAGCGLKLSELYDNVDLNPST